MIAARLAFLSLVLAWLSVDSQPLSALGGTIHAFPFLDQFLFTTDGLGELDAPHEGDRGDRAGHAQDEKGRELEEGHDRLFGHDKGREIPEMDPRDDRARHFRRVHNAFRVRRVLASR